mmetsp:Transcript_4994/g.5910  ORF Transcript_4994/g.5910 Transcript_4994/m.5910 type:complete len:127 (+) Transcript_4994:28-408(+)
MATDWLSLLGVQKGLTGLAKDFTMNYLGREAYHSINGPLVNAIKEASDTLATSDAKLVQQSLKKVCFEGKRIFQTGGSLHEMLSDLLELLEDKGVKKALPVVLKTSQKLQEALRYFSGPRVENEEL